MMSDMSTHPDNRPSFADRAVQRCPFDAYDRLREESPVYFAPEMNAFVVTRADLIQQVLDAPSIFSNHAMDVSVINESVGDEVRAIRAQGYAPVPYMSTGDPPDHTYYRRMAVKLFDPRRIRGLQGDIERLGKQLINPLIARGGGEFMREVAMPLPVMVVASLLGVPPEHWRRFRAWGDAHVAVVSRTVTPEQEIECAKASLEFQAYMLPVIHDRRKERQADLISDLVHTPLPDLDRRLDDGELLSAIRQFMVAGGETTTYSMGSGILMLAQDRALYDRLRADETLIPKFVEEVLRMRSPSQGIFRLVLSDTEIGGVPVPKGSYVHIRLAAGNRDAALFENPHEMLFDRRNGNRHLSFGGGIHICLGSQLARAELVTVFQKMIREAEIELDEAGGGYDYIESKMFMGLSDLHLKLSPTSAFAA